MGESRSALVAATEPMRNWPNVTVAREAAELADGDSDGVGESLTRLLVVGLGLGPVQTQFGLRNDGRTVWCDVRVGRHIIEFDGKVKYRPVAEGGFATKSPDEVLWEEKLRQDFVSGFKLGMSRVVWSDILLPQWAGTSARVLRECLATNDLFGTSIDDLAPYVVRRHRGAVLL